ncbi:MAG: twitching motility protein PilT [Lachnospiraceae bacterium]|nr:twitching motility protein PilT [Lachnospiraceae bacterium]
MIELVVGEKGKGKTKILMGKANNDVKVTGGNIVYLDRNNKHMYELSNRVRLINVPDYNIRSADMFLGFVYGIASQDHDLDRMFLDNFMSISCIETVEEVENMIKELSIISEKFEIDFVIGISMGKDDLTQYLKELVVISL